MNLVERFGWGGGGGTGKVLDEHVKVERDEFSTGRNLQIPN